MGVLRLAASRGSSSWFSSISRATPPLTRDVDPTTSICADGQVRIGPSPGKGLGAFATALIEPSDDEIVRYGGEIYRGMRELHLRYGKDGVTAPGPAHFRLAQGWSREQDVEWYERWKNERRDRGVSVTGQYVFNAGIDHATGFVTMVDAEDFDHADTTWARFINHCSREPNLVVTCELVDPVTGKRASDDFRRSHTGALSVPAVRLFVSRVIQPGEELLYSYGGSMGEFAEQQQGRPNDA